MSILAGQAIRSRNSFLKDRDIKSGCQSEDIYLFLGATHRRLFVRLESLGVRTNLIDPDIQILHPTTEQPSFLSENDGKPEDGLVCFILNV